MKMKVLVACEYSGRVRDALMRKDMTLSHAIWKQVRV